MSGPVAVDDEDAMSVAGFPALGCSGLSSAVETLAGSDETEGSLGGTGLDEDSASGGCWMRLGGDCEGLVVSLVVGAF